MYSAPSTLWIPCSLMSDSDRHGSRPALTAAGSLSGESVVSHIAQKKKTTSEATWRKTAIVSVAALI
jgi:hypothetical protein